MEADIRAQTRFYRRGMILGLSMAEIVTLIIFVLLLTLAVSLRYKDKQIAALTRTVQSQETQVATLVEKINILLPNAGSKNQFDDMFRELRLAQQEAEQAKQRIAVLEERAKTTAPLVEQLVTANRAESSVGEKVVWLSDRIRLAEAVSQIIQKAGLLPDGSQMILAEVEKLLASLSGLQTALAKGSYESGSIDQFVHQTLAQLHQADVRNTTLQGQIRNLQQVCKGIGKGTEKPACWASPETGAPEYIFNVALTSMGVIVRDNMLPHRREEQQQLPLQTMIFNTEQPPKHFLVASQPLLEWSNAHECRFFVQIFDRTQGYEKDIYKRHLRTVGQRFYYYEASNGKF
jgi:hypothetical protein